jgi:hypothetical protein
MTRNILKFLIVVVMVRVVFSQSVPTNSWVYTSIHKLQIMGKLRDLPIGSKPYSRISIAEELINFKADSLSQISHQRVDYQLLVDEFEIEIKYLEDFHDEFLQGGFDFSSKLSKLQAPSHRLAAGVTYHIYPQLRLQYNAILDQSLNSDSNYMGDEWRGFIGYQDQLSFVYESDYIKTLFGRDYLDWGYGHTGNLFISDNSRPFDMLKLIIRGRRLHIEAFTAQLDQMYGAERYLSASRVTLSPSDRMTFSVGQSALYGGINRTVDFTLSNPLSFYSFSQDNDKKYMNAMLYADFALRVKNRANIYGEILIDDFQIDNEEISDLEPNEIAFLLGVEGVQLFGFLDYWLEAVQVRNRTYNVAEWRSFEKFLHKGKSIAHKYGTDFQLLATQMDTWLTPTLNGYVNASFLKSGEGTIQGVFTEPWMAINSIQAGYTEKIPFGTIENTYSIALGLIWKPRKYFEVNSIWEYNAVTNLNNVLGHNTRSSYFQIQIASSIDKLISL